MKSIWKTIGLSVALVSVSAIAGINAEPTIATVNFQAAQSAADLDALTETSPWLQGLRQTDGTIDVTQGAWVASADLPFGQGALILGLHREDIAADLALTLIYEETRGGDFIVQLWDAEGQILAADLFSNIIVAGREAKTDTFILDLARYPTATQVVLRRLSGEIRIYGLILSPVACEAPMSECDAFEMAIQLDEHITPDSALVQASAEIVPSQENPLNWSERTMQQAVDVIEENPFARDALTAADYPVYMPSTDNIEGELHLQFTASSLLGVLRMLRLLNAHHPQAHGDAIHSLSSYGALRPFLAGETKLCIMSIPMSLADRERFFRSRGYPVMEFPVALDPILVVVHPDNPIRELTIPQLDAIFGTELRAGAEKRIQTWGDLGLEGEWADRPITLWGGSAQTGTSRLFRKFVLQDGPFDSRLQNDPYSMYIGVIYAVAKDPSAIGFLNAQNSSPGVPTLALSPQTGVPAYSPTPEDVYANRYPLTRSLTLYVDAASPEQIDPLTREFLNLLYSREGQEFFALSKQAPLSAAQVRKIRERLGL